jgi:hypothetical protein
VLPGSQRQLVLGSSSSTVPRVVVTAVDRYGSESAAVDVRP